jgi:hypothetical protein
MLDVHADAEPQICYPAVYRFRPDDDRLDSETAGVKPELNDLRPALAEAPRHTADTPAWWKAVVAARLAGSADDSRTGNAFLGRLAQAFRRTAA